MMVSKVGRNSLCRCGSGKKSKHCCEVPKSKNKVLTQNGLNRCFLKLVKDSDGSLDILCKDVDGLPKDEMLGIKYDAVKDSFHFTVVCTTAKVEQKAVLQPDKRIIMPN